MPLNNSTIIQKAAVVLNDLSTAGRLNVEQSSHFIKMLIDQPTLMRTCRTVPMNGDRKKIEKIGIGKRILHGATEGTGLDEDKKIKPDFGKVELNCKEFIAEINITDDTLENNIEGKSIEDTIMSLIAQRVALDLEELIINGDTTIDPTKDDFLSVLDGIKKKAVSHVVDWQKQTISKDAFKAARKALPAKFGRIARDMKFYVSDSVAIDWTDALVTRATNAGDSALLTGTVPPAYGVPVEGIAMLLPRNIGTDAAPVEGSDALYTHPQNIVVGISRDIRVETDRDIRARMNIIVLTLKIDVIFEEEDAVVKITNIKHA